jgi:formamidopyrimidine-DNA glycosylase
MPELPEVETTKIGIRPWITDILIEDVVIREDRLRWRIPNYIRSRLVGNKIKSVTRRAKYLLLNLKHGSAIIHLGMSGSLRVIESNEPPMKHDHFDIVFSKKISLRYRDPRRFGAFFWSEKPQEHKLLSKLGVEPLLDEFTGDYLWEKSRNRKTTIKQLIMNSQIVVGVGNIYASESLFLSGINPSLRANRVSKIRLKELVSKIKTVLNEAIKAGGTTLQDYYKSDGNAGYFKQELKVYGKEDSPCIICDASILMKKLGQRSTFYCKNCQT